MRSPGGSRQTSDPRGEERYKTDVKSSAGKRTAIKPGVQQQKLREPRWERRAVTYLFGFFVFCSALGYLLTSACLPVETPSSLINSFSCRHSHWAKILGARSYQTRLHMKMEMHCGTVTVFNFQPLKRCAVNMMVQQENNPFSATEQTSPIEFVPQLSGRDTKEPFPLVNEPFPPDSTDASGRNDTSISILTPIFTSVLQTPQEGRESGQLVHQGGVETDHRKTGKSRMEMGSNEFPQQLPVQRCQAHQSSINRAKQQLARLTHQTHVKRYLHHTSSLNIEIKANFSKQHLRIPVQLAVKATSF